MLTLSIWLNIIASFYAMEIVYLQHSEPTISTWILAIAAGYCLATAFWTWFYKE